MDSCISISKKPYFRYVIRLILVLFVFVGSIYLFPYYTMGDQEHYRYVYLEMPKLSLIEGYRFYNDNLSSYEIFHFLVVWVFSRFVEKDILMAVSNSMLAFVIVSFMERRNVSLLVTSVLILSNFYLYVHYFSAERLKFGMIFFMLSVTFTSRIGGGLSALLAVFSHVQFVVLYVSIFVKGFVERFLYFLSTGLVYKYAFIYFIIITFLLYAMKDQLYSKAIAYYSVGAVENIYKLSVFFALTLYYAKSKKILLCIYLPLLLAAFFFGDDRLNLFGYFVFMYYALQVNRGVNVGVLLTSAYYSYKGYGFILMLLDHGDPFYLDITY